MLSPTISRTLFPYNKVPGISRELCCWTSEEVYSQQQTRMLNQTIQFITAVLGCAEADHKHTMSAHWAPSMLARIPCKGTGRRLWCGAMTYHLFGRATPVATAPVVAGSDGEQAPAAAEAGDLGILKGLLEGQGVTGALDHSKIEGAFWAGCSGPRSWV